MQFIHYKLCDQKPIARKQENRFLPVVAFEKPATSKGSKLYIVKKSNRILYVGITRQSITNRLWYGFRAKGVGGYYGYKWKGVKGSLDLLIWHFPGSTAQSIEAVEAEVVFAIRHRTGAWPLFQTEIHFHAPNVKERALTKSILKELFK